MQTKGVVSGRLLGVLWGGCAYPDAVRQLMVSLGLMVPVLARDEDPDPDPDSEEFLVCPSYLLVFALSPCSFL
jgi:hypothetical protein